MLMRFSPTLISICPRFFYCWILWWLVHGSGWSSHIVQIPISSWTLLWEIMHEYFVFLCFCMKLIVRWSHHGWKPQIQNILLCLWTRLECRGCFNIFPINVICCAGMTWWYAAAAAAANDDDDNDTIRIFLVKRGSHMKTHKATNGIC